MGDVPQNCRRLVGSNAGVPVSDLSFWCYGKAIASGKAKVELTVARYARRVRVYTAYDRPLWQGARHRGSDARRGMLAGKLSKLEWAMLLPRRK